MIHRIVDEASGRVSFVISSREQWLEGVYDSERAARYAFRFPEEVLAELQESVNARPADPNKRVITFEMLQEARKRLTPAEGE